LKKERPEMLVGAGSVLDAETARACVGEGAMFIVSPAFDEKTVDYCGQKGIAVLPGALTPTEVLRAWNAGADVVKIFPASAMGGAKYLTALKGPLPQIAMIPTGGVSLTTARDFLEAGAYALGVGSELVDAKAIAAGQPEKVTATAKKYMEIVREFQRA
jgi:2-dehydro-3-deoxyphosphogluconate aldolase/(4S)-4-hydroxy-2-oxoglutarate aldolase